MGLTGGSPRVEEEDYRDAHRAADAAAPELRRRFLQAVREKAAELDEDALAAAIIEGGAEGVLELIGGLTSEELAEPAREAFQDGGELAGQALDEALRAATAIRAAKEGEPSAELRFRFDGLNPQAVAIADELAGAMIVQIDEELRFAIQRQVLLAQVDGIPPRELARRIRDEGLGLTSRQMEAVVNFRRKLEKLGDLDLETINRRTTRYYDALVRQRATTIAISETIQAAELGQAESWRQAADLGLISRQSQEEWVATFDDRLDHSICEPMDGRKKKLGEAWLLPNGARVPVPARSHPRCRCTATLIPEIIL